MASGSQDQESTQDRGVRRTSLGECGFVRGGMEGCFSEGIRQGARLFFTRHLLIPRLWSRKSKCCFGRYNMSPGIDLLTARISFHCWTSLYHCFGQLILFICGLFLATWIDEVVYWPCNRSRGKGLARNLSVGTSWRTCIYSFAPIVG